MSLRIAIVMDPIANITPYKDTSFALCLEAQRRGYEISYIEMQDLFIDNGIPYALTRSLSVIDRETDFYTLGEQQTQLLGDFDALLMRKDPPVDDQFIYATHIFELAEQYGVVVVNKAQALRDFNEKLFTAYFPDLIPDTLVTRSKTLAKAFHAKHQDIICKPLDGMGGASIFRIKEDANNLGVVIETLTQNGQKLAMFQAYLPAIKDGDKRVLIVNGEVMDYCLARLPQGTETRGNLAAGGIGRPQPISASDRALAEAIAPTLVKHGILFVGLDVIGDRVTEINITSPTCVREIEKASGVNICGKLFDAVAQRVAANQNQ
ncbi:MAG TPA: glutathione synthase [Glaciecola sp.]|nr:glutathione synthase [Glaciecola sp.]HAQ48103.1 glutathione synthase [Glaciecola sp.]HCF78100.1 glutathione synthase [Glaciecola sp.]